MSVNAQRVELGNYFDMGALCGAAKLYHYAAGTNTTKDIWSDQTMTTPLPQPFISDQNGIFDFFADGYYRIIITKSDGTVLKTLDNWKWADAGQPELSTGIPVPTSSSMNLGDSTWAHWTGSVDVAALSGSSIFYWAVADGNFSLLNSSNLILPDARNRKVLSGDVLLFLNEGAGTWRLSAHMQKEGGWTGRLSVAGAVAAATLAIPTDGDFVDVSGGTTITAVATASAGYRFRARFTGTGLNITHNATSLISPWGYTYRTVPNEIIEFQSLGSGNWIFYSLNGPKEKIGTILEEPTTVIPAGFLDVTGQTPLRATYPGLYAYLGSGAVYGNGDGSTTFNLPDDRGRCVIGMDAGANRVTAASLNGGNANTLGGTGGEQTHTLVTSEIPSHVHGLGFQAVGTAAGGGAAGSYGNGANTSATGGDGAHNNMPPWTARKKIIRF